MEWSIQEVARAAGTTSRTLRHYGELGLLTPSRIGVNGYRYYDQASIVRLQRILLLRELGLGLAAIGEVLENLTDQTDALRTHVQWLESERSRIDRQLQAVRRTITAIETEQEIDMNDMLDGFDYKQYEQEVAERWGADTAKRSAQWWEGLSSDEQRDFRGRVERLNADWRELAASGAQPTGQQAQSLARRHVDWLTSVPGTPADAGTDARNAYVLGLGEMYVADERFAANYGGVQGATFVRDALRHWVDVASQ